MIQEKCPVMAPYVRNLGLKEANSSLQIPREITLNNL